MDNSWIVKVKKVIEDAAAELEKAHSAFRQALLRYQPSGVLQVNNVRADDVQKFMDDTETFVTVGKDLADMVDGNIRNINEDAEKRVAAAEKERDQWKAKAEDAGGSLELADLRAEELSAICDQQRIEIGVLQQSLTTYRLEGEGEGEGEGEKVSDEELTAAKAAAVPIV